MKLKDKMSDKKLVGVYDKKKGRGRLGKLSYITVPKRFTEKDILDLGYCLVVKEFYTGKIPQ
tara:strand:- start:36 stop:221 length:186 start_codon:yes stop_codon:yes gene_type:complete